MSQDKSQTPPIDLRMKLGHAPGTSVAEIRNRRERAGLTMEAFSLPRAAHKHHAAYVRWNEQQFRFYVRDADRDCYAELEKQHPAWRMFPIPDAKAQHASDRCEWIRLDPTLNGAIVLTLDADFREARVRVSASTCPPMRDPLWISRAINECVRRFDLEARKRGAKFAGFETGTHVIYPSVSSGLGVPPKYWAPGLRYFRENLTLETSERAGRYPQGEDFVEGAFRILEIAQEFGPDAVGFLDAYSFTFGQRPVAELDAARRDAIKRLDERFGTYVVEINGKLKEMSWVFSRAPYGLNQKLAGTGRNRKKNLTISPL